MPENKTEALIVAPKTPKPVKWSQREEIFVPRIRVRMPDGTAIRVPKDAAANKNASIILAEAARNFVADQIKKFSEKARPVTPAEMKDMMAAAKLANEICIVAHEEIFAPSEGPSFAKKPANQTGAIYKAVEAAARGMTQGNADSQARILERFQSLKQIPKPVHVIDVEATVVTPTAKTP